MRIVLKTIVLLVIAVLIGLIMRFKILPELSKQSTLGIFGDMREMAFGLKGDLYFLPANTERLPDFRTMQSKGVIYAQEFNVPTRNFDQGFPGVTDRFEWFALDYTGQFFTSRPGTYSFRLTSDDGSRLLIDRQVVIDLDRTHPTETQTGAITLGYGFHQLELQYFQGPRYYVALVLEVAPAGEGFRIFNTQEFSFLRVDLYWLKILLSLFAYLVLLVLTSYVLFELLYAVGIRPRYARVCVLMFFVTLLSLVISAHLVGVIQRPSAMLWMTIVAMLLTFAITILWGGGRESQHKNLKRGSCDPF